MERIRLVLLVIAAGLSLVTATGLAKTPDSRTPAEETVCDVFGGAAFGLCNAYCEATDCGDGVNKANDGACKSLRKNWAKHTGLAEFPCDCRDPDVFIPGEGCRCDGPDLVPQIVDLQVNCFDRAGQACGHTVIIEVENQSDVAVGSFEVLVAIPEALLMQVVEFDGLNANSSTGEVAVLVGDGPTESCLDPTCVVVATVDPENKVEECSEDNTVSAEFDQPVQPFCGDGNVDPGEECDLGEQNGVPGSGCTNTCGFEVVICDPDLPCAALVESQLAALCDNDDPNIMCGADPNVPGVTVGTCTGCRIEAAGGGDGLCATTVNCIRNGNP